MSQYEILKLMKLYLAVLVVLSAMIVGILLFICGYLYILVGQ
jgi:hypothetical protein